MVNSLRIVTFNTQLRSWAMEAGARGDPFFAETAEKRARAIGRRIRSSPFDYDIVALNEVFDEDAREILVGELGGKYAHSLTKADVESVGTQLFGAALALSTSALLAAYGITILLNTKFEDSGLMLFSRFPFATIPPPAGFEDLFPASLPYVFFLPYTLSNGGDSFAAKGAVFARIMLGPSDPCDVIISHTQAAYESDDEHKETRTLQLREVFEMIKAHIGLPLPPDREVIFMGDLNVEGTFRNSGVSQEWRDTFDVPGGFFTDGIHDLWVHEQSPGAWFATPASKPQAYPGPWDLGLTTADGKRLDYILGRPPGDDRLTTQHLSIAYELMTSNPAVDGDVIPYTSDHYPLRADLAREHEGCRAATASAVPFNPSNPHFHADGTLRAGWMHWYRFDQPGTYAFKVIPLDGIEPRFEVYVGSNLSIPMAQYRLEELDDYGLKYVLPDAPFFVRVFFPDRTAEGRYQFRSFRFTGRSRSEAIQLVPHVPVRHATKGDGPLNTDDPATPWDEGDAVWFCIDTDRVDSGRKQDVVVRISHLYNVPIFNLIILLQDDDGNLHKLGETGSVEDQGEFRWDTAERVRLYLLVKRDDPRYPPGHPLKYSATDFVVEWTTNLTYLFGLKGGRPGNELRLICSDETDGFLGSEAGADDIRVELKTDGALDQTISNGDIGDFDEGDVRSLEPWVNVVRYIDSYKVELVEMDDLSEDDRASVTIPNIAKVEALAGTFNPLSKEGDGTLHGWFQIDFGDGKYRFHCSLARWLPI
jgi:hypothetical protein